MSEADKTVYRVQGFSCANCAGKFENNVQKLPAVHGAKVKIEMITDQKQLFSGEVKVYAYR